MLERLQFSIPMSRTIAAPIDIVWEALTDLPSHPIMYSSVEKVEPIEVDRSRNSFLSGSGSGASGSQNTTTNSNSKSSINNNRNGRRQGSSGGSSLQSNQPAHHHLFKGSKWKITRLSVLENQRYSSKVTVTQYNIEKGDECDRRSYTLSTHEMLGATCSLKIIVEPIENNRTASETNHSNSNSSSCQVNVIMTMIPYQFFVKLLGIMCCLCLLKSRARMAMDCDLEELAAFCENKVKEQSTNDENQINQSSHDRRRSSLEMSEEKSNDSHNQGGEEQSQRSSSSSEENEADAAGGGYQPQYPQQEENNQSNNNLQPIIEEE